MRQGTKASGGMITTGVKPQPVSKVKTTGSPKRTATGDFMSYLVIKYFNYQNANIGARAVVKPSSPAKSRQRHAADGMDSISK